MIDLRAYNELHGEPDDVSEDGDEEPHTVLREQDDPPPGPFLLLLPPTIKAFRFHDKKWSKHPAYFPRFEGNPVLILYRQKILR